MATPQTATPLAERFRENVKRVLDEQGISRTLLAERLGCSGAHVTQMLKSDFEGVRLDTLQKWAAALEVDPVELLRKIDA